jgi:hypothetical protein
MVVVGELGLRRSKGTALVGIVEGTASVGIPHEAVTIAVNRINPTTPNPTR